MDSVFKNNSGQPAYIQLYLYFRNLILSGAIPSDGKLPSIRSCAQTYGVSKTTVESAYVQLEAEGCIYSVPQSGFYAAKLSDFTPHGSSSKKENTDGAKGDYLFDFTSSAADEESFDFNLWQRYIKSALRTGSRLLDYGNPQGEEDLRKALCAYLSRSRGIICDESKIVIGAGVQNLLQLLCVLEKSQGSVLFTGMPYKKGETIFEDYARRVERAENCDFADIPKTVKMIYTSPSHINLLGDVMPLSQRIDLLNSARRNNCIIIEDDYDSELSYTGHPVPALRSLDAGERVVYIGTFSRLLIPSVRISFMVLTDELCARYEKIKNLYNQTASKTEQIALCRYISDGHLYSRIKKTKKLYAEKTKAFYNGIKDSGGSDVKIQMGASGFFVAVSMPTKKTEEFKLLAKGEKLNIWYIESSEKGETMLLFSVSAIPHEKISLASCEINKLLNNF